ncbi:hypothetical protein RclHR1_19820001 [Rhizophagus clarus]|uniref:Uncharacterized protein n=1 Tax=Rhizophagus clarus TaxID=94130 RepID=A0A2Z6QPA5_9GLOM|nr:hypothetical protein RclHR1_19820001 [Rhizophagus clarus]
MDVDGEEEPDTSSKKRSNEDMDINLSTSKKKAKKPVRREDSPILKKLIKELSAPIPQQTSSGSTISLQTFPDMNIDSVNFCELNDRIIKAEDDNKRTTLELIHSYYYFGKGHRKRKEKAIKIFKFFDGVGTVNKVNCIKTFSASTISRIIKAEDDNKRTTLELIHSYYYFGKGYRLWFDHYKKTYSDDTSNSLVNDKIREYFPDQDKTSKANLRKRKEKAIKIFKLFDGVGEVNKVNCIKTFSASTILRLGVEDIDYVIAKVLKAG